MPEQVKIIQRRLLVLNQRVLENAERKWSAFTGISGRHAPESVVGMNRNWWSACIGIGGRHEPELVVGMHRNRWSAWPGLRIEDRAVWYPIRMSQQVRIRTERLDG